ncbi:MAG TPA: outer membrane beta-barrel protein [bacterium]|nr:outer membrane beta-barrel protein [bacterium]
MKQLRLRVARATGLVLLILVAFIQPALGAPAKGVGFFGGAASYTSSAKAYSGAEYKSSGLGLGVDFQYPLGDKLSVNPFYMLSAETSSQLVSGNSVSNDILGVQIRFWPNDNLFVGAHLGLYGQSVDAPSVSASGSGFGFGVAAGYEQEINQKIILLANLQYDSASSLSVFSDTDIDLTGTRLNIGVRIKLNQQ